MSKFITNCKSVKSSFIQVSKFQVKWYNSKVSNTFHSRLPVKYPRKRINRGEILPWGTKAGSHHAHNLEKSSTSHWLWQDSEMPFHNPPPGLQGGKWSESFSLTFIDGTWARNDIIQRKWTACQVAGPNSHPSGFLLPRLIIPLRNIQQIVLKAQEHTSYKENRTRQKSSRQRQRAIWFQTKALFWVLDGRERMSW